MCTLAWGSDCGQLWACFNRDELRSRPSAELSKLSGDPGGRLAFARDPVGKGTWFAVSECGFLVALLNKYPQGQGPKNFHHMSRGQLVLQIVGQNSLKSADHFLKKTDLELFAPFYLFILSIEESIGHAWNGNALCPLDCSRQFWTSSSYLQDEVISWRKALWEERTSGKSLNLFSAGKIMQECSSKHPAFGLTVDRDDARTVSQIRVLTDESGFNFDYLKREDPGTGYRQPLSLQCSR